MSLLKISESKTIASLRRSKLLDVGTGTEIGEYGRKLKRRECGRNRFMKDTIYKRTTRELAGAEPIPFT
jgi:hypothetical protein